MKTETDKLNNRLITIEQQMEQLLQIYKLDAEQHKQQQIPSMELFPDISIQGTKKQQSEDEKKRYWTDEEHLMYLQGLFMFGKSDVNSIQQLISTRAIDQIRSHQQKYLLKLDKCLKEVDQQFSSLLNQFKDMTKRLSPKWEGISQILQSLKFSAPKVVDETLLHYQDLPIEVFTTWSQNMVQFNSVVNKQTAEEHLSVKSSLLSQKPLEFLLRAILVYVQFDKIKDMYVMSIYNFSQAVGISFVDAVSYVYMIQVCFM
uniref:Myb-like DNA-binding domain-containing protein n=1 Tax=Trepomonas sp. PC1 TaxID=1076344 RepID=A0A146K592_9EUKA|eukprot:JAP91548.1 Myb-like DNA-binding domain-containing protein [Trepomonas sp. PC1]